MAKIPDSLPTATVEGVRPSDQVVAPTDFGLESVGAQAEGVADMARQTDRLQIRAQAKLDRQAAQPLFLKLQNANEDAFAADAAAYTGDQPGFAADQIDKAQQRGQRIADGSDMAPGVKAEFQTLAHGEVNRIGQQAIAHEAKVRAQPINEARIAADETQINGGLTTYLTQFAPAKQGLIDAFDGSQKGLTDQIGQASDAAAQAALAATPDRLKPNLQVRLAAMRTQEMATAAVAEQKAQDAFVLKNGTDQANRLINGISSNPDAYGDVVATGLPAIVDTLPKGLKKDALTELNGQAATARIKGLVDQGKVNQAQAELADGRYDAFWKPQVKEELEAHVQVALREHGPKSFDEWMAADDVRRRADAETYARMTTGKSTGQVSLDDVVAKLSPEQAAHYATQWKSADQAFASAGAIHDMPTGQVHALAAQPPPEPTDPDYASKITAYQVQQAAAAAELKARANPGQWAYTAAPAKAGRPGVAVAQDRGAALQQGWTSYLGAVPGQPRQAAGRAIASQSLGVQEAAGLDPGAWQVVPQTEAARLAATVINAPPEGKLQAMQSLAGLVADLPASVRTQTGQTVSAQAILTKQLLAAHMTPSEVAAMVDFGSDPAKLGRYVAALNDPTLKAKLPQGQQGNLTAAVQTSLKPFLDSVAPLPGAQALAQARIDRTVLIARGLMAHQGMNPGTAAAQAAKDMTDGYTYVDTWRMPQPLAAGLHPVIDRVGDLPTVSLRSGAGDARAGAAAMLSQLTANNGANLYAPAGPGGPDDRRRLYALQIAHAGRWVTAPDDSGLTLMVPHPDGTWDQAADRYGRPVRASWGQLQGLANGTAPSPLASPPPTALRTPDGQPVPAASKAAVFSALAWAVNGKESGFRGGQASSAGALGQMQVTPATVQTYAPRLGLPVDLDRAQHDDGYNRRIGEAALQDQLQHYGTGPGIALALAAYNAGPGRVDGYRDPKTNQWQPGWLSSLGDPRTGRISVDDWVKRIPYAETRDYVRSVLPVALRRLQANH
ncbi:transglycosylase SLT domain-containing protein [Phenylobacterium sp.]|uniref:transglycosylase SLT domain-containing protein n=1 Tax=Phenylobacterium sp. TaxID=1871053 RepID=UPI002DF0C86C|nr:transglycosylase SLT domain-containing protein [Phenylobacterium sp.]